MWIPLAAAGLSGLFSFLGSRSAARAQAKALQQAMAKQEEMRKAFMAHQIDQSKRLQDTLKGYAEPFYEDSKRLSSGLVNELENFERQRLSPEQLMDNPIVKAMNDQSMNRMAPILAKQGLYGSTAGTKMMADTIYNNGLNTVSQLRDMENKTRDSIANSRAAGLSQTMKLPEAFASGISGLESSQANALGNVESGTQRNMAGFGQNMANVQGQKFYDYGNIASNTINNLAGIYQQHKREQEFAPYRKRILESMAGGGAQKGMSY